MKHSAFQFLLLAYAGWAFPMAEWPQYLGPNRDGVVAAPGLFDGETRLTQLWTQPLGSGFSGIVVGGGKCYTMHTAGAMDALSCFDAATGAKQWSFAYGPTFPKVGSSEPGPLSTPVLDGDRVYGLGAHGELFCLEADSGKKVWARDIVKDMGAVPREEGITTSPLVYGDFLVLNLGDRKDKGIAAFNKKTGALAWHSGAEIISFQSPSLVTLMGHKQIVSLSEDRMRGLDPSTGGLLWETESKHWIQMIPIGDNQVLAGHYHGFALYQMEDAVTINLTGDWLNPSADKSKLTEKWYNSYLTLEYAMPVYHKGFLYGFKGNLLRCLDLATGEKLWSSRATGGGMAILVDGHLAILSPDGIFRIARAWEKGYEERANIKVFQQAGLTAPSFADGVFYLRNYTHLAAVRVK